MECRCFAACLTLLQSVHVRTVTACSQECLLNERFHGLLNLCDVVQTNRKTTNKTKQKNKQEEKSSMDKNGNNNMFYRKACLVLVGIINTWYC